MALIEIASFADHTVAEIARGLLGSNGIDAMLFDGGVASLGLGRMTPARLMVDEADHAAAERLLDCASA